MLLARFFQLLLNEIDDVSDITIILPAIKSHTLQDTLDMFFTDYYVVIYCQGTNNGIRTFGQRPFGNGHLVNGHLVNGHLANKCMGGHLANRQF